ncbi:MAG: hypothetical protein M1813_000933 [Trichoglossum hirsutum]|nr:MAG: hypothetical protein M1813_000933 [Trichoglossum hirsutum]
MRIPVTSTKAKPYSMDDNIAHCSYEVGALGDPSIPPPDDMWTRTVDPRAASDEPIDVAILFEQGLPVKLRVSDKEYTESLELFITLDEIGKTTGIGRIDIVENAEVRLRCYKGSVSVPSRSSETEKLYDAEEASMDSLVDFSPLDTSGFIINAIRFKKYGMQKVEEEQSLSKVMNVDSCYDPTDRSLLAGRVPVHMRGATTSAFKSLLIRLLRVSYD